MKPIKIASLLLLFIAAAGLVSCHVGRFFIWNFADIRDYKKFRQHDIKKGGELFMYCVCRDSSAVKLPKGINVKKQHYTFDELLRKSKTAAFLVIRNDTLLYEQYPNGYSRSSIVPSFSMAKSFTSMLVGIAIDEGAIKSVHDPITKYLPELQHKGMEKVTIENLLDMQSGIRFGENYMNPFGGVAKFYYGRNLGKYIRKLKIEKEPGGQFKYLSVNSQLLGMIVERATHKPLAEYMQEKIWQHIGTEYDGGWSIDSRKHGVAKGFCCFNACAVDYAKLGRLYLKKGSWNGKQIVSENWVNSSLAVDSNKNRGWYSYQWWHTQPTDFYANGYLGQYIYVYPQKNIVIVRLGKKDGFSAWPWLMREIAKAN